MKRVINIYKVEVGVLLRKDNDEYDSYAGVYDKQHAYYDEGVAFFTNKRAAMRSLKNYVKRGVLNTYGVLSRLAYIPDEIYGDDYAALVKEDMRSIREEQNLENYQDIFGYDNYDQANVVFTMYKVEDRKFAPIF
jgi:hypothetical protein